MPHDYEGEVERIRELFQFLQGKLPKGWKVDEADKDRYPKLTADQAWTVVHFVQEMHWQLPDTIERCGVCGDLFHSDCEGGYSEDHPPYNFCEPCWDRVPQTTDT